MLVIRLQRTGRRNEPTFRVVLTEHSAPMKSGEQEILGHYLPSRPEPVLECDQERVLHWVSKGATPSDTIARLLTRKGVKNLEKYIKPYAKRKPKKEAPPEAKAAPVQEPPQNAKPADTQPADAVQEGGDTTEKQG